MTARRLPAELVAISPGDLGGDDAAAARRAFAFLGALERCRDAGLRALLLREPAMSDRAYLELARTVRAILGPERWLGVHDRAHLVAAVRADAVHLGFRSLAPEAARTILGPEIAVGFSAHAGDDLAVWRASDYVFLGPVLDTPSKRGIKPPLGFDALATLVRESPVPAWAIGGLAPEHVVRARESGARGVAVLAGIFGAADPAAATAAYVRACESS